MNYKNDRERSSTKFCSWFCYTETNFTFFSRAFIVDLEHIVGFPLALLRIHLHSRRKVMLLKVTLVFGQFGTYSFWYCRTFLIIFRNVIIFKKKKKMFKLIWFHSEIWPEILPWLILKLHNAKLLKFKV